jgi:hypothetical protein
MALTVERRHSSLGSPTIDWTPQKDKFIRDQYKITPASKIAKILGITKASVIRRARKLGIIGPLVINLNSKARTGYGNVYGWLYSEIRTNAARYNIYFDISVKETDEIFVKQNATCALSGKPISISPAQVYRKDGNASLDRIDSHGGYVKDNCQWLDKEINKMKGPLTEEKYIENCYLIVITDLKKQNPSCQMQKLIDVLSQKGTLQ